MLLINAALEPMESPAIARGFVSLREGKIHAFGPMEDLDFEDDETMDLSGMTIYPGFVDAHCHLGVFNDSLGIEGEDGNEDTDPCTPNLRGIDAVHPFDRGFGEALRAGITTVITGPGSANPIGGQMCALKTHGDCVDDMAINPAVAMKMAFGENPKMTYHARSLAPVTRMATAGIIRDQLWKAQRYQRDLLRAQEDEDIDEPEFDCKCEALLPVLNREMKVHIHAHRADDICTAIRICKEFNLDYVLIHCTEGHMVRRRLAAVGATVVCGPIIGSRTKPELSNATLENPALLNDSNVELSICTDHPEVPIDFLLVSAGIAMREGLPRQKALEAVTIVPARQCDIADRVGSIAVGKDGDLAVFDRDPLTLEAKPRYVFAGGELVYSSSSHR